MNTNSERNVENGFRKTAGICLSLGSFLATITMVLHPSGGNIQHIAKMKSMLVFSHSIAILCLPFIGFGFWGLSQLLQSKSKISTLAFIVFSFGLVAAMIAATINGLTLPNFVENYGSDLNNFSNVQMVINYGKNINIPMALIFISATLISIGIWSILIIISEQLPKWIGYLGLIIVLVALISLFSKFNFTSVIGFRIFVFGIVIWITACGIEMIKCKKN